MSHVVVPAWKNVIVERSTPSFSPGPHRLPCRLPGLKLNWPLGPLLHYNGAVANAAAQHDVTDPDLATSQPCSLLPIAKVKKVPGRAADDVGRARTGLSRPAAVSARALRPVTDLRSKGGVLGSRINGKMSHRSSPQNWLDLPTYSIISNDRLAEQSPGTAALNQSERLLSMYFAIPTSTCRRRRCSRPMLSDTRALSVNAIAVASLGRGSGCRRTTASCGTS